MTILGLSAYDVPRLSNRSEAASYELMTKIFEPGTLRNVRDPYLSPNSANPSGMRVRGMSKISIAGLFNQFRSPERLRYDSHFREVVEA